MNTRERIASVMRRSARRAAAGAIFFLMAYACGVTPVHADFEDTGYGARTSGMGNSFTGLADDVYAIMYNPAGLGTLRGRQFTASYRKLYWGLDDYSDLGESFFAYAQPVKSVPQWLSSRLPEVRDWGTVGVGLLNFHASSLYSENTFIISYGKSLEDVTDRPLYGGMNVKILSKQYASTPYTENAIDFAGNAYGRDPVFSNGYGKTTVGIDLASYYRLNDQYSLGLMLANVNSPDTGLKHLSPLPLQVKAGLCYHDATSNILLDGSYQAGGFLFSPGIERWVLDRQFAVRGGLQVGSRQVANLSMGASYLHGKMYRFDYSFMLPLQGVKDTLGNHEITLVVFFDAPGDASAGAAEAAPEEKPAKYVEALGYYKDKKYLKAYDAFQETAGTLSAGSTYGKLSIDYVGRIKTAMARSARKGAADKEAAYAKAFALYADKKYPECLAAWQQYLGIDPQNTEVQEYAAKIQARLEEEKQRAISDALRMAHERYANKEYAGALAKLQQVLQAAPGHAEATALAAEINAKMEEEKKAQVNEYYTRGLMLYTDKKFKEAIDEFQKCLKLDPVFQPALDYIQRARLELNKAAQEKEAKQEPAPQTPVKPVEIIDQGKAEELYNNALIKYNQGMLSEAVANLEEALKYNPDHQGVREAIGRIKSEAERQTSLEESTGTMKQ